MFNGNAVANLNGQISNVVGDVGVTAAAIGNSLTVDVARGGSVSNVQYANYDPTANLNLSSYNIAGDLSSTAAAIANTATISGEVASIGSQQVNAAYTVANTNARINKVVGDVSITSAAIGNSLTIKGF